MHVTSPNVCHFGLYIITIMLLKMAAIEIKELPPPVYINDLILWEGFI